MTVSVTIIMPCYNAAKHLPASVGSVLEQTFSDWELIAVDDGSDDNTLRWLRAQTDPRLRIHAQANQGVSAARNAGLALAQGRYIAFLDADDTWSPDFLAQMVAALDGRPDAVMAYCGWQNVGAPGARSEPFIPPDYETPAKIETLFTGCRWPIHAALVRHAELTVAGGFDQRLKNAEDFALWLEVATAAPIVRVPIVMAHYHFHGDGQASANRGRAALHHLEAQRAFLARHPEFHATLGNKQARKIIYGELLQRGFECYWRRDLSAARQIFRIVMSRCYGSPKEWIYMLPAWLPEILHRRLIEIKSKLSKYLHDPA